MVSTTWCNQDYLGLTVNQWRDFLQDPSIFDENALRLVCFVYEQTNHTSTASDIAVSFKVHYNRITAWNRKVSKLLYEYFDVDAPIDVHGKKRYWNVLFDGNPQLPKDPNGHFYWILRPNLVEAIESLGLAK